MTASDRDEYNHGDKLNDYPYTVDLIGWGKGLRCTMTVNEAVEGTKDDPGHLADNQLVPVQPGVYTIEDWDRNERGTWYGIVVSGEMVIVSG